MRASQDLSQPPQALPETEIDEENFGLSPDSYTARKLVGPSLFFKVMSWFINLCSIYNNQLQQHASPEHLHITSRRTFIGPVPRIWLQYHRKSWRKTWLGLKDSSSRLATFSVNAAFDHINTRQLTGFTTTPNERIYSSSFPQPDGTYENREPMKPTSIVPVDTSQEELAAGNQQLNHIESEHYGDLGHMTNALDRQRSNVRRSSTDHATIEEYFTPSESLERKNRSGIFDSINTQTRHPGILNADQNIRRQPTTASDSTPNQPETPFLSLSTCESPPGTDATESTTSLIPHKKRCPAKLISKESSRRLRARESCDGAVPSGKGGTDHPPTDQGISSNVTSGMVRFQQDSSTAVNPQPRVEPRKPKARERAKGRRRTLLPSNDGEIIRAEPDQDDNEGRSILLRTMAEERAIAAGIIKTCMDTLSEFPEWASILKVWPGSEKMGLAWRRYDRLEWVHGANEDRMYGTIAMRTSHELELRPKRHYPTSIKHCGAKEATEEPPPAEGFLILLTSQKGKHQRLGKSYSRRLYFHVQNQYLCFCRPGRAMPPPPPRPPTTAGSNIPTVSQLSKDIPMIYSIDPYPLRNGKITWLSSVARHHREQHDAEAYHESRRNLKNLERAEGYFDLCRVLEVRVASQHHFPEESHTNGGDVDFHGEARDSTTRGGPEQDHQSRSNRSFELVMSGGLVVEFRAYNMQTRDEWVQRLSDLVRYWTARTREDVAIMKSVRRQNLELLNITEDQEFMFEQFASTWEVSKAQTSPELFNICGISGCRTVKMSGLLYCKPRRRSAFTACNVILTEGQILCFQSLIRKLSGEETPHTHHEREWVLDLDDCYIYSGLITNSDLLYQNHTIDTNLPSQHASPRVYTTDGWTSSDEDIATCFVLWQNSRKSVFRSQEKQGETGERTKKWKKVSTLGVPGRSIVFNTRSRAERDMWVLMIETEINRLQQLEDVRIVSQDM
ncbi:PH domain-containing protein [Histoplasma capsulatum var. duboisii H88]|uniref:PH domain-containing protein n=2 Tax=Ajellomyces capsulatus TaxID=5037 RepID=F0UPH6_AJEC8|nr:PH domain-containing protein [Histoplasma capsulatum H143]EGC47775.1 PH domain-containing protein [Histoplasma capsulatum var. duboisii H88]